MSNETTPDEQQTLQQKKEAEDRLVVVDAAPVVLPHVERVYRSSETRTPIVVSLSDGNPHESVEVLAKENGCAVWSIKMGTAHDERNALDYIEVGTQNGDWVYLTNVENASWDVLRRIGMELYTLAPNPKRFPRRSLFRLVLVTEEAININDHVKPVLPQAMLQHSLVARRLPEDRARDLRIPSKVQRRMPADPPPFEEACAKHARRREEGRDSDSESDADEPEKKVTGLWFHRAVDFYAVDGDSTVARVNEVIYDAVDAQDTATILELCSSGRLSNLDALKRDGMNPLMYAVSRDRVESVKALLASGADVHVRREADGCPLLFMCIDTTEIAMALLEAGANIDERYEGCRIEDHPSTTPHVAALVRQLKGMPPAKTSALELASAIGA